MGKLGYNKMMPMTAIEKRQRDAEAAAVRQFLQKPPMVGSTSAKVVRFAKIKDTTDRVAEAATLVQKLWRGFAGRKDAAALKVAVTASKLEAAAAAAEDRESETLKSSLALLMGGKQLGSSAVVDGHRRNREERGLPPVPRDEHVRSRRGFAQQELPADAWSGTGCAARMRKTIF